jgi:septum formation inhibitor MinC
VSFSYQFVRTARERVSRLDASAGVGFFRTSEESRNIPPPEKVKSRTGGSRGVEAELRSRPAFKDQAPSAQSHVSDCQRILVLTSSIEKSVAQEPDLVARRLQVEALQQGVLPPVKIFMYNLEPEYNWDIASQSLKDFRSKRDSPNSQDAESSTPRSHGIQHSTSFFLVSDLLASGKRCYKKQTA